MLERGVYKQPSYLPYSHDHFLCNSTLSFPHNIKPKVRIMSSLLINFGKDWLYESCASQAFCRYTLLDILILPFCNYIRKRFRIIKVARSHLRFFIQTSFSLFTFLLFGSLILVRVTLLPCSLFLLLLSLQVAFRILWGGNFFIH